MLLTGTYSNADLANLRESLRTLHLDSGVRLGMILTVDTPITQFWLAAGILLYLIALRLEFFVQRPTGERMIRIAQGDVEGMNIPDGNAFPSLATS